MGFELLKDSGGHAFVRAFYTAQSMDQLRELQPLTASNPPAFSYFPIPGCGVKGEPLCVRWRPSRRSSAASWRTRRRTELYLLGETEAAAFARGPPFFFLPSPLAGEGDPRRGSDERVSRRQTKEGSHGFAVRPLIRQSALRPTPSPAREKGSYSFTTCPVFADCPAASARARASTPST
jgi:hypothetical protein